MQDENRVMRRKSDKKYEKCHIPRDSKANSAILFLPDGYPVKHPSLSIK